MVLLNSSLEGYSLFDSFAPLPPGEYHVNIMDSELKNTRAGGTMLSFVYEIMDGDFQGRRVWDNLNLWHSNPKTVEIAMRQLKSIATASGYPNPNFIPDSSDLHGREMKVRLAIRSDGNGNRHQEIRAYLPLDPPPGGHAAQAAAQTSRAFQGVPSPPLAGPASKKPWE